MDPDQVYWIWVLEGVEPFLKKESGSACFAAKVASSLKRVEPSFMNSVTGSLCGAKYSNILQDTSH